jgi:acyl-CoA thioesterase I
MMRPSAWLPAMALLANCAGPPPRAVVAEAGPATGPHEIVALGASNTIGRGRGATPDGVEPDQAYPAQLERMLAGAGCRARVLNAGRAGDTTAQLLERLPGVVAPGTRVVILQPGGNDARRGEAGGSAANLEAIRAAVAARGARLVVLDRLGRIAGPHRLPDGQHFSAAGHALFAAHLAPQVRAAGACSA